jgi:hypothetical protein
MTAPQPTSDKFEANLTLAQPSITLTDTRKMDDKRSFEALDTKGGLTQEQRDLADASYHHLNASEQTKQGASEPANVDIQEHKLSLTAVADALDTSFDVKDVSRSYGLTTEEASARLERDGRNVLTQTKRKSALRKVCCWSSLDPLLMCKYSLLNGYLRCSTFF